MFRFALAVQPAKRALSTPATAARVSRAAVRAFSSDNTNAEKKAEEGAATDGNTAAAAPATDAETIAKLQEEIKELKDHLLRAYADGENIRRIAHRDVDNARAYANSSFAKAMLEISDDLERAISVVPADFKHKGDATLKTLVEGIEMTEKNLQKVFNKFGVVRYGDVNDKFDPNVHDALFQVPDAENEPDTIAQIVKKGYKIKDRVLRPAEVGTRFKP